MAREGRGYFAIGVYRSKTEANIGTLWRTASLYGAAFVFTVGKRYDRQASDTPNTPLHTPLFHFESVDELVAHLPHSCPLIGVEMDARSVPLDSFVHPARGAYLLGAEDHGLPRDIVARCHRLVQIECPQPWSMNVAVAGSLVIYNRHMKASDALAVTA